MAIYCFDRSLCLRCHDAVERRIGLCLDVELRAGRQADILAVHEGIPAEHALSSKIHGERAIAPFLYIENPWLDQGFDKALAMSL